MALAPEDQGALIGAGLVTNPTQIAAARAILIARAQAASGTLAARAGREYGAPYTAEVPNSRGAPQPLYGGPPLPPGARLDVGSDDRLDPGGVPYGPRFRSPPGGGILSYPPLDPGGQRLFWFPKVPDIIFGPNHNPPLAS